MLFGSKVNRLAASGKRALSKYAVGTAEPELAFDFIDNKYVTSNSTTPIASAVTHSRAGNATMTDGYGTELVTNGNFASDSDWTKGTGWSIADGKSSRTNTGATSGLSQTITLTADVVYEVSYFLQIDSGNIATQFIGGTNVAATAHTTSGYKTDYIKANTGNTQIRLWASTTFEGSIDNVSVREMPVIKWAPHNLFTESENLADSDWTKTESTVTQVSTTLPDGTTGTASRIQDSGKGNVIQQLSTSVGQKYTIAIWAKRNGATDQTFRLFGDSGGSFFSSDFTATEDWELFEYEGTVATGGTGNFGVSDDSSSGTYDILVWGAHLYRSDLGGMADNPDQPASRASYVPTTSAAAYLPRVGHHVYNGDAWVNEGVLAESESRTNIITGNDDLDSTTYWSFGGNLTAAKDSSVAAPDGNSAWKLTNGTIGNFYFTSTVGSIAPSAGNYITLSCYLKKGSAQYALLGFGGSVHSACVFDLNSNTITDTSSNGMGTPTLTTTVESVGNGWFRVGFTHLQDTASPSRGMSVYPWITSTVPASLDGHGQTGASETLYVAFPQAEYYATPSSTIPTSGSSVTRAAETFTIPSANLPWPDPVYIGSELVTNGTFDTDSDWTKGTGWSIGSGVASCDGTQTAVSNITQANSGMVTGKVYVFSMDVTRTAGTVRFAVFDGASGQSPTIASSGTLEWYYVAVRDDDTILARASADFVGSIDNFSIREINPLSVSIAMDGRVTYADTGTVNEAVFGRWAADSNNGIVLGIDTDGADTGQFKAYQVESSVSDRVETAADYFSPGINVPFNVASRHGSTFINGAVDGVALTEDTTPTALPDLSATDLELGYDYMGTIGTFRIWKRDLGDTGIVEATNPSLEPSLSLTFEGTGEGSFVVRDWSE